MSQSEVWRASEWLVPEDDGRLQLDVLRIARCGQKRADPGDQECPVVGDLDTDEVAGATWVEGARVGRWRGRHVIGAISEGGQRGEIGGARDGDDVDRDTRLARRRGHEHRHLAAELVLEGR